MRAALTPCADLPFAGAHPPRLILPAALFGFFVASLLFCTIPACFTVTTTSEKNALFIVSISPNFFLSIAFVEPLGVIHRFAQTAFR